MGDDLPNTEFLGKNLGKNEMRNFYVIASGYLLFTMTDSSLRMTVLLELFQRRYNALEISYMFILYEFIGVFKNLFGGIMGSRLGLRFCLLVGLTAQVIGIAILCGLQADWSKAVVIIYVVIAQGFSGIAKYLVKIGGKSVTKLVTNDQEKPRLFKLVAWLTGAKNSIKVPLPLFLRGPSIGWSYIPTGAFLAGWVMFYVFIQSITPQLILKPIKQYPLKSGKVLVPATFLLLLLSIGVAIGMTVVQPSPSITLKYVSLLVLLFVGLFLFALIFAINSSIHSFLILAYCKHDKVAANIGFYYMANALGRAWGLIIGGILFYYLDFYACLWASVVSLIFCIVISYFLGSVPRPDENEP
ncbi:2262_t:CDS:2 [Entrophospora sp. SA101]|nr:2262_t:CDS:2 [Entrophospora sp. SA101]